MHSYHYFNTENKRDIQCSSIHQYFKKKKGHIKVLNFPNQPLFASQRLHLWNNLKYLCDWMMALAERNQILSQQFILFHTFTQFSKIEQQQEQMGCQTSSLMEADPNFNRHQSLTTEQEVELKAETIINRQRGDPHAIYHFSKVIWRGRTTVRKVLDRTSRIERIIKILSGGRNVNLLASFQQVQILKQLNHPNIVQIVEYFSHSNFLYIILENIPGLTLHEAYVRQEIRSLEVIIQIVKQILIALRFCHQKGFVHKAINPEHVMIVRLAKSSSYLVKLVGFGRALKNGSNRPHKSIVRQDPIFDPPELDTEQLADKQDIWGCGIIFLELISGERKFDNFLERVNIIIHEVMRKQVMPEQHRQIIIDFMTRMLCLSPQGRLSAEEALNHDIFRMTHKKTIYVQQNNSEVMSKLLQFRVENNLKSLFFIYATLNILSVEEKSVYLREFYNLDKNKDGKIDFDEIVEGMQNTFQVDLETAVERVKKIFQLTNKDRGHYLQFHEYVAATTLASKQFYEHKLVKLFEELDSNKDGKITKDQLAHAVEGVKSGHLLKNFGRQEITYSEFKDLLMSMFKEESSIDG